MDHLLQKRTFSGHKAGVISSLQNEAFLQRINSNSTGFWESYRVYFIIFLLALMCDTASTMFFMTKMGAEAELHPVIRMLSELTGPIMGPILGAIGKTWACIAVTLYLRKFAAFILISASVIYVWAAWYNITGVYMFYYSNHYFFAGF